RHAIHAVAQAGRLWAVVEDMAEVPATATTVHLRARCEEAAVLTRADRIIQGLPEARPSGAAVVLRLRRVYGQVAAGAVVGAGRVILVQRTRESVLRAVLAQHIELLRREQLLPFFL